MHVLTATVDFADVAAAWHGFLDGSLQIGRQRDAISTQAGLWRGAPGFTGATEAQMQGWLKDGYTVPGMTIRGENTRPRRKVRYSEDEGELQVDLALSGEDRIFLDRKPRKRQRAIKLEIELAVRANTPTSVLTDYAIWLGKLITGLEGGGFQTQIDVVSRCRGLSSAKQNDTVIRVKKFNERSALKSWSALLSPGGFRHLVFCARILGCEQHKVRCSPGMGGSFGPTWDLSFDPAERKLTVRCAASTGRFPVEQMDAKLAAIKF